MASAPALALARRGSLSPDDPLYGATPPEQDSALFLGLLALHGERGLLRISSEWLLRLRHNPFHDYLIERTAQWLDPIELDH